MEDDLRVDICGGRRGDGVRQRLDEEEAVAFFFATIAFTAFPAAAALISRTDAS